MTFGAFCLCQRHAARHDVSALYQFLMRERIAKEGRAQVWRRLWVIESAGEPDGHSLERHRFQRGQLSEEARWFQRNAVQARRDFHELFAERAPQESVL